MGIKQKVMNWACQICNNIINKESLRADTACPLKMKEKLKTFQEDLLALRVTRKKSYSQTTVSGVVTRCEGWIKRQKGDILIIMMKN